MTIYSWFIDLLILIGTLTKNYKLCTITPDKRIIKYNVGKLYYKWEEKVRLVQNDPVTCARYFQQLSFNFTLSIIIASIRHS